MLDLTGAEGSVRESTSVNIVLYHETGGAVLTQLTPVVLETPTPGNYAAQDCALDALYELAEEYYRDVLVGTPFLAAVQGGVQLFSAHSRAEVDSWEGVVENLRHGLIVRPAAQD
jgi:hypothetical protein